jgi:hypothetical protein
MEWIGIPVTVLSLEFPFPLNVLDSAYAFLFHVPFADL